MARKISQFTEATEIKSGDISIVVQDGETKQFPLDLLATKAQADEYKAGVETQLADYEQEITDIKNQYDKELYTPTITVTNTSMVKTGQGDTLDYSASVEDGVVKSAILKGQTLVNLYQFKSTSTATLNTTYEYNDNKYIVTNNGNDGYVKTDITVYLEANKTYTFKAKCDKGFNNDNGYIYLLLNNSTSNNKKIANENTTFTVPTSGIYYVRLDVRASSEPYIFSDLMILEGDYTNIDIPYFEGMTSVKAPVLTTTGKNLLDYTDTSLLVNGSTINNGIITVGTNYQSFLKMNVKVGKTYKVAIDITANSEIAPSSLCLGVSNSSGSYSADYGGVLTGTKNGRCYLSFTATQNAVYLQGRVECSYSNIMLIESSESNTSDIPYEPYKSNILSTSEDVELRGIGEVQDELDLMTGEKISKLEQLTAINNTNWATQTSIHSDCYSFYYNPQIAKSNGLLICDNLPSVISLSNGEGCRITGTGRININILKSKLKDSSLDSLNDYLARNPLTFIYELPNASIKTVVLTPSGTLASETPYMWKNGSIQLSSNGLVPGLDYAVTTSRVGVIENNMSETITNEKRIHALEVILAQSTIAAAADAVSLQSDLESTTMSTDGAQLETENTQDNFLYEMILLLIENNAHDESLFDKVCMFYLYGKLSDEQFTNIYNLLYPVNQEEE